MPTATLIENDLARRLKQECKLKTLEISKAVNCKVFLTLEADAFKALNDDPLLLAKLTEAASAKYYDLVNALKIQLRVVDSEVFKTNVKSERQKKVDDLNKWIRSQLKAFTKEGAKAATLAWAKVAKTKEEYKKYKVKAGVDLAIDALALTAGVASTVGSAGFALVVGLYGIIKGVIGLSTKIYKLAIDADKMQKKVTSGLKTVQKSFNKKKKEISGAKDTGKAFVNSLLGTSFLSTIDTVKKDNEQYKSKLQGVDVSAHNLAKELNKVLLQLDKIAKDEDVKRTKAVAKLVDKLQTSTGKLLDKITAMQSQVQKGMVFQKNTADAVAELETCQPKKWKWIQKGMVVTDIVLAGGDFSKAGDAVLTVGTALVAEVDRQLLDRV